MKLPYFSGALQNLIQKLGRLTRIVTKKALLFTAAIALFIFPMLSFLPQTVGADDLLEFSLSSSSGRPGMPLGANQVDPCPALPTSAHYQYLKFTFTDSNNVQSKSSDYALEPDGNWGSQIGLMLPWGSLDHASKVFTPELATGLVNIKAQCMIVVSIGNMLDPNDDVIEPGAEYAPEPLMITAQSHQFSMSASEIESGKILHFQSIDPCNGEVSGSFLGSEENGMFSATTNPDGSWSADVEVAGYSMTPQKPKLPRDTYQVNVTCSWSNNGTVPLWYYGAKLLEVTGKNYVALGDSYSAGEGLEPFMPGTDGAPGWNDCHRSTQAYPHLLYGDPDIAFIMRKQNFAACSGVTTDGVLNGSKGEEPQINRITASTDVVTMTIGGNDMDFGGFARECVLNDCSGSPKNTAMNKIVDDVIPNVRETVEEIRDRLIDLDNTNAKVMVVGYPQVVTATPWPNYEATGCEWLDGDHEAVAIREVTTALNTAIKNEVESIGYNFVFVSANGGNSPFAGHELCRDSLVHGQPYFFNVIPFPEEKQRYSFHPNALGQQAYADLIKANLY